MKVKALLLGVLVACSSLLFAQGKDVTSFEGKKMPAFKITTVKNTVITNKSTKGKVVLMDFWATWCGPCVKLAPTMQALHAKYAKKGVVVIGANVSSKTDSKATVADYAKKHGYTYNFGYNCDALSASLKVVGIPTVLVINKQGKITKVLVGNQPDAKAELEKAIQSAMK
jgi:thiol-disulfide isomerase/thioredoxin